MKSKIIFSTIAYILFVLQLIAQDNPSKTYVKAYGAYSFLSPGSFKGEPSVPSSDSISYKVGKKGLGEGFRVGVGIGLILNNFINIELNAEYLKGNTIKNSAGYSDTKTTIRSVTTMTHSFLNVIPGISFKAVTKPSFHIYNRLGLILGIPLEVKEDYQYQYKKIILSGSGPLPVRTYHNIVTTSQSEYQLKVGIGYTVTLGTQIRITDRVKAFVETTGSQLALNRNKYEDLQRVRRENTGGTDEATPVNSTSDHTTNLIYYKEQGHVNKQVVVRPDHNVNVYTFPQDPININSLSAAAGILLRF
jgi:hypothetical protein